MFRFVAIRPPVATTAPTERLAADEEVAAPLVAEMASNSGRLPSEVRAEIGARLLASDDYYARHPVARLLLPVLGEFAALFAEGPSHDDFVEAASGILASALVEDVDLGRFAASERFGELRRVFWLGYCANLLAPNGSPDARAEAAEGLRVLRLLETAADPEDYAALLPRMAALRPAVPFALLRPDSRPTAPEPPSGRAAGEGVAEERERIRKEIGRLHDTRQTVKRVSTEKLKGSLRGAQSRLYSARGPAEGRSGAAPVRSGDPHGGASDELPWQLVHEDLRNEAESRAVLEDLGLTFEATPVPALIDAIDRRIATLNAAADELGKREELALVGGTMRRVTRRVPPSRPDGGAR